jgi:hypothetical protein
MTKTVAAKMGLADGLRAIFIDAPDEAVDAIELPNLVLAKRLNGLFDYIHLFVKTEKEFTKQFPRLKPHLAEKGMLWVSWPKGKQLNGDLTIKNVIKNGYDFGLVESTTLSINSTWSAIKFTHPKKGKTYHNSYGTLNMTVSLCLYYTFYVLFI